MTDSRKEILARCSKLYVAALSDAADEVGLRRVSMDPGIIPVTINRQMSGFARTGRYVRSPSRHPFDENQFLRMLTLVSDARNDDVVVIDQGGASDCAAWGHVLTTISMNAGVRGAVIDGPSRDVDDIDKDSFAVFARGRHPGSTRGRFDVESINQPIVCGGVSVNPGDLVFADADGVVVIPKDRIDEVLNHAEKIAETDNWWIKKLKEGRKPHDLHKERMLP